MRLCDALVVCVTFLFASTGSCGHGAAEQHVTPIASLISARSGHTATLLRDGQVLIAGGMNGNGSYFDSVELYQPQTRSFSAGAALGTPRVGHTATLLNDGTVLVAGGYNGQYLAGAELFDPKTRRWTPIGPMRTARSEHVAVLLHDETVLLAGGIGTGWSFLATAEIFDPVRRAFTPVGNMSEPRESHTATVLRDGRVLIAGGHKGRRADMTVFASAEIYDPGKRVFVGAHNMTTARHKHGATLLPNGDVLIAGGSDARDWSGKYRSAEIFDVRTGAFRAIANMHEDRFKLANAILTLADGRALLAGGAAALEMYDPRTAGFSVGARLSGPRYFSSATQLPNGAVLIVGGYDDHNQADARAWLYHP